MDEEISKEQETTGTNSQIGNPPQATGLIDKANIAAERLEAANKKQEELISRQEDIAAKNMLAGTAEAGQAQEVKEETPQEYAKKVLANDI